MPRMAGENLNPKILVTGAESFVGKWLLDSFDRQGISYIGIDLAPSTRKNVFQESIQSKNLERLFPENLDAVIHLAAMSRDADCKNKAYNCFDINVMGTLNLIDLAEKKGTKQFIFASTEWVYDQFIPGEAIDESMPISALSLKSEYAFSKLASEVNLAQKYQHGFCSTTILRFGIIYGPRKNNWSAVESLFHSVSTTDEIKVGSLNTGRCFIHVSDIAEAIVRSIGLPGFNTLNIQGERLITLGEVIETSRRILKKEIRVVETNPHSKSVRWISNQKAKKTLSWFPKVDLDSGLKSLEADCR